MKNATKGIKIYFLRHGETTDSITGGYCGSLDPELTPAGNQMAEDFAKSYTLLPWTAILSSPYRRAVAMAKPLSDTTGIRIQFRDELKEISFGQWEGKTHEEVDSEFHDDYIRWLADPGWNAPTGGQKGIEIARIGSFILGEIRNTYTSGNILVVSHKATIRIILCLLLGIDVGRFRDRLSMPVGSISIVEMGAYGPLLHILGDRSYMRESLRNLAID